jgi:hypothetical protein
MIIFLNVIQHNNLSLLCSYETLNQACLLWSVYLKKAAIKHLFRDSKEQVEIPIQIPVFQKFG